MKLQLFTDMLFVHMNQLEGLSMHRKAEETKEPSAARFESHKAMFCQYLIKNKVDCSPAKELAEKVGLEAICLSSFSRVLDLDMDLDGEAVML